MDRRWHRGQWGHEHRYSVKSEKRETSGEKVTKTLRKHIMQVWVISPYCNPRLKLLKCRTKNWPILTSTENPNLPFLARTRICASVTQQRLMLELYFNDIIYGLVRFRDTFRELICFISFTPSLGICPFEMYR